MKEAPNIDAVKKAWAELPEGLRAEMEARGVDGPDFSLHANGHGHAPMDDDGVSRVSSPLSPHEDSPLDVLREKLATLTAEELLAWIEQEKQDALKRENALMLHRVIATLIRPGLNILVATWALAFATGLDCVTGMKSQRQCAQALGIDRQLLNYYVSMWRDVLGFATRKFCRTQEARAAYQARAFAVHERKRAEAPVAD